MDSTGINLHPNWRALATIHIPLKRFIQEGKQYNENNLTSDTPQKYNIEHNFDGEEVKQFYEKTVNYSKQQLRDQQKTGVNNSNPNGSKKECVERKVSFEQSKFFRYAVSNNIEELGKIDFTTGNINSCDIYGWTALMMSACEGAIDAVKLLLKLGADVNIKDRSGLKAIDLATKKGYTKIVTLIKEFNQQETVEIDLEEASPELRKEEPFFCGVCRKQFTDTSLREHQTSTVHQFNTKSELPINKLQKFNIPPKNRGLQLMVKQGWDKESGLGPTQSGRLYPIKTVLRKQRTGLGIKQDVPRVTHFGAFDLNAVKHKPMFSTKKSHTKNDMKREKQREWKKERRLRHELS
ncbi:G patch domain and ankyrin repeat-containing protein 1 homolog [Teleopsis dalmanni]|uniref:G patch domain and ankyrin repeat-containing protein 1 homolog n=1 Tax=Teleopsis dalmanni TaxID=139649 RepID=UPI0018CDD1DD|nr:G patch domain and ankyrin repeat-containing protein 1 homolog [Teleopsis dalmanni]